MEYSFTRNGYLWPVIDKQGKTVLFQSKDSAELYAEAFGLEVGDPMPTMRAVSIWYAYRMTLAEDGKTYETRPIASVDRRIEAKRPGMKMCGRFSLDIYAHTRGEARLLADRAGRLAVEAVKEGCDPIMAVGRLSYGTARNWIEETQAE